MSLQSCWEFISSSLKGGWSQETKNLGFFLFCTCTSSLPLPFPRLCTTLPQGLGICLLSVKMATPDDKVLFCPCVTKPGSVCFVLCHLCTMPMAGRSVWFSPPHFGCLGEMPIGKSSRSGWRPVCFSACPIEHKAMVILHRCHIYFLCLLLLFLYCYDSCQCIRKWLQANFLL